MRKVNVKVSEKDRKIARILLEHCIKLKKGDSVEINSEVPARDLILELYKQIIKKGAYPRLNLNFEGLGYTFYKYASQEQLRHFPKISYYAIKNTDAILHICAPENNYELAEINPKRITLRQKNVKKYIEARHKIRRWVIFNYPVEEFAKDARMSISEYKKFVYDACIQDWDKFAGEMGRIKKILDKGKTIRIIGKDTDISMNIKGRPFKIHDEENNMPGGEIFTSPHENSVDGCISFTFPRVDMGRPIEGIRLKFKKGKLVKYSAKKNFEELDALIKTDKGSCKIGELGIGTNYRIKKHTKTILFDEKIGGTIHMAIGRAFEECKGTNKSSIHADMIKDMRKPFGGKIFLDNRLIYRDGRFLI